MESLKQHPVGATLPESPHAVVCSLPRLADVRAYQEKDPAALEKVRTGYPRFVRHPFLLRLEAFVRGRKGWAAEDLLYFVRPEAALDRLLPKPEARASAEIFDYAPDCRIIRLPAAHPSGPDLAKRIQHIGCVVSSRVAEALLVDAGVLAQPFVESRGSEETAEVRAAVANLIGAPVVSTWLSNSGMSAFFSAFEAVRKVQLKKGRGLWIQLGWLYVDTGKILDGFLGEGERVVSLPEVGDLSALEGVLAKHPGALAGVVIETPTNPLGQVADLVKLRQMVHRAGGLLIADPSMASAYNVDVFPKTDLYVQSLTKYTGWTGDLLMGVCALNPGAPDHAELHQELERTAVPPGRPEVARLAWALPQAPAKVARMNQNARKLAVALAGHPAVRQLWWSGSEGACAQYSEISRGPECGGAVLTFNLKANFPLFYDAITALKGPSFGAEFTIVCPYLFLAHYDMVTSSEGEAVLAQFGLDPCLVRVSVGCEPIEQLLQVFGRALDLAHAAG